MYRNKFDTVYNDLISEIKCWKGYTAEGKKTIKKNGKKKRVNNCVKVKK